jgi:hypothetical protein
MTRRRSCPLAPSLAFVACILAAGCTGDMRSATAPAAAPAAPPVDMAGRLVSASGRTCAMTFTAAAAGDGSIAPEGGCAANFYTSRRWVLEQGSLLIQDHKLKPLMVMKQNAAGGFEGELANGEVIRLER